MSKRIEAGLSSLAVCVAIASVPNSWAEDTSDSTIQEKAIGVSSAQALAATTFDSEVLALRGINGLTDMAGMNSAGLILEPSTFNSAAYELSLRGITGTNTHTITGDAGVGVFIDGAYIGRSQGLAMDLLDIEEVTVARGSQAILSGRNTSGGAVYLSSSKPTGEFGFEQRIQFGEVGDESTLITHLNLPKFAEALSTKLSYLVHRHDGYVKNVADDGSNSGRENFSVRDNEGYKIALRFDEGGDFTFDYSLLDATIDSSVGFYQNLSLNPDFLEEADVPGLPESSVDITHHSQSMALQGERGVLTSVISYRDVESRENATYGGVLGANVDDFYNRSSLVEQQQFTQKVQFDTYLHDGALDLTVGLENYNEQATVDEGGFAGSSNVDTLAFYAQAVVTLSETMDFVVGWRETSEEKAIRSIFHQDQIAALQGARIDLKDDNTSYSGALKVALTENASSYISYATSYKSGGASLYSDSLAIGTGGFFTPYDAEEIETLEIGFESVMFDGAVNLSLALFSNDIKDKQITISDPNNLRVSDVVNVSGSTTVEGAEIDLSAELFSGFVVSGNYTYLDAPTAEVVDPFTGNTIEVYAAGAAEHNGAVAIDWTFGDDEEGAFKVHVDYKGLGSYFFNETNANSHSRDIVNVRLSASGFQLEDSSGKIEIGIWAHNLLDDEYLVNSEWVDRNSAGAYEAGTFGEPQSYGIDLIYRM